MTSSGLDRAPTSTSRGAAAGPYGSASSAGPITGALYHRVVPELAVSVSFPAAPVPTAPAEADRVEDWDRSGAAALTGRADGPALVPPGRAASLARTLAVWLPLEIDGPALLGERAAFTGHARRGSVSAGGACRLLPTADGWAAVSCARPDDPALLRALIEDDGPGDPWTAVSRWLRRHSGAELADRAVLLGVAAHPVQPRQAACAPLAEAGSLRSAAGLRVVDFSALWAGPLCANLLGLAGAEVIKVEAPSRLDGARLGNPEFYRLLHAGHRSVILDPGTARGRTALAALAASAGLVIESSRPRALASWGLRPEDTPATWISITAAGRASARVGFGDDVAASAGLVAWDDEGPMFAGDAIADPLAGLTAAARALSEPPGSLIEISMTDVVAGTLDGSRTAVARHAAPPRARRLAGEAHAPGADTDAVLREL